MVKSFEDDVLTIDLANGTSVSGLVTDSTEIECESDDDGTAITGVIAVTAPATTTATKTARAAATVTTTVTTMATKTTTRTSTMVATARPMT